MIGKTAAGRKGAEEIGALSGDDLTDDALTGSFRVFQRRRGHRYSLDDTLTAWAALTARPAARSCLDLGCGIGSVLLMLGFKLPRARLAGVEAQRVSHGLALRNVERNGLVGRVSLRLGDLRDRALMDALRARVAPAGFELVVGTPPYRPPGAGSVSPDSQRAHARVELRGGVEDYLASAARMLATGGLVVVCADARRPERVIDAAAGVGLRPLSVLPVVPAAGKPALFSVWQLGAAAGTSIEQPAGSPVEQSASSPVEQSPFVARDGLGARSEASLALRCFFGLPTNRAERPSPRLRARGQ